MLAHRLRQWANLKQSCQCNGGVSAIMTCACWIQFIIIIYLFTDYGRKKKVYGYLSVGPPDNQPGDQCRTKSIYAWQYGNEIFPRTPVVKLLADTEDVIVKLSSTKRDRFTYEMCKKSSVANWPTVKLYFRATCEFLPLLLL